MLRCSLRGVRACVHACMCVLHTRGHAPPGSAISEVLIKLEGKADSEGLRASVLFNDSDPRSSDDTRCPGALHVHSFDRYF